MTGTTFPLAVQAFLAVLSASVLLLLLISLLDDLIVDGWFWSRRFLRSRDWRASAGHAAPLTAERMRARSEQPLAILVTSWKQTAALTAMLEHLQSSLQYRNFQIFVGVYPNDTDSIVAIERLCAAHPRIHRIDVPHLGPTCRADALNWVVEGVFAHELRAANQFAGMVVQGNGDVLHPLSLAYFNYLLPRKDLIQLPVATLAQPWHALVAGAVMDEYAQVHGKDMVLREVAGIVPSAGGGMCLSRQALQALVRLTCAKPFDVASLNDDHGVSRALARLDLRTLFGVFPVQTTPQQEMLATTLAVRRHLPATFARAGRHKARRMLDLLLNSSKWPLPDWPLAAQYLRFREKKFIVMAFVVALAYPLSALAFLTSDWLPVDGWTGLIAVVALLLVSRLGHRAYFTARLYGWRHGAMAVPRAVVGHAVDLVAAIWAWRLYFAYTVQGKKLTWDKTMQTRYRPNPSVPTRSRAQLGELLMAWQAVEGGELEAALREQRATHLPLGRILVSSGWLDEETLAEAIAYQENLPRAQLSVDLVQAHAGHLALHICTLHRVVYIGCDSAQCPVLAVASPLPQSVVDELTLIFSEVPAQRIVRESEIAIALRLLRGAHESFKPIRNGIAGVPLLGDMLIEQSLLSRNVFESALQGYRPERHGRLGDYLVERGVIVRDVIERVVMQQRLMHAEVTRVGR
jgi:bacteriophage N4 adsorption protein B